MGLLGSTLVMYLLAGGAVAVAVYLTECEGSLLDRGFRILTAVAFWPLYLPSLLAHGRGALPSEAPPPQDAMAAAIAQVDTELEGMLGCLDGWAEEVRAREKDRLRLLRTAWSAQAKRIREMDRLLALQEPAEAAGDGAADGFGANDRLRQIQQARRQNLEQLRSLRQQAHDELMGTLAWVRELVSMIHLAKFSGAPAERAEKLVAQITAVAERPAASKVWEESGIRAVER